jgi:hypothetical protein
MVHSMGLSLSSELEYRRSRLVTTSRSLPRGSRGTRRAERAERDAGEPRSARHARPTTAPRAA